MRKALLSLIIGVLLALGTPTSFLSNPIPQAEARSGCCSHHGGVCGCGCCDGSSLSAKCAPYYPWCNGGGSNYAPTPQVKRCPANSSLAGDTCYCNSGYALLGNSCIRIPSNAHEANNGRDAWECDDGYIEKGNSCIIKPPPIVNSSSSSSVPQSSVSSVSVSSSVSSSEISSSVETEQPPVVNATPPRKGIFHRFWSFFFGS